MEQEFDISKEGYLKLIKEVYKKKLEERELALDRYRKADEQMVSEEQFMMLGKNAVSYLTLASTSTSDIAQIAKEIKSIVYKDNDNGAVTVNLGEDFKKEIADALKDEENKKTDTD